VSGRKKQIWLLIVLAGVMSSVTVCPTSYAQEELTRKVKSRIDPIYPPVARRMSIGGTVKVAVVVSPNGSVKTMKVVGGHPLLVTAATDALRKWKFENAAEESTGIVEFKFQPPQ
jgi:TonB family protein